MAKSFPPLPSTMRAMQYYSTTGGLEKNLTLNPSASLPTPKANQYLIRILAVALNPVDYKPSEQIGRFVIPKPATPCVDFSGVVVKPAANSPFKSGQLIFGVSGSSPLAGGALAEYNAAARDAVVAIPDGVDPVHAATVGVAGLTAYQSIVPKIRKGDRVFINGGSGGCGVFGIQIAKAAGCFVVASCSGRNVEFCRGLGADEVVDYTKGSVLEALKMSPGGLFDHVVDNVGEDQELIWRCHEFLKPGKVYVKVGAKLSLVELSRGAKRKLWPAGLGGVKRKVEGFFPKPDVDHLNQIAKWMEEGKVKAVIDQKFAFEDAPKAFEKLKTGRARGKIVVDVASETYKKV